MCLSSCSFPIVTLPSAKQKSCVGLGDKGLPCPWLAGLGSCVQTRSFWPGKVARKVWVATSAKRRGEETVGPRQCRLRAVLLLQGAIVREASACWGEDGERGSVQDDGGRQGEDGNAVTATAPHLWR